MKHTGKPINIALNIKYLTDALVVSGNEVKLKFMANKMCQVEQGNYYCLISATAKPAVAKPDFDKKSA
jgi:DNA polymerase III sliding clamp (beta) subunit (PCNA family)